MERQIMPVRDSDKKIESIIIRSEMVNGSLKGLIFFRRDRQNTTPGIMLAENPAGLSKLPVIAK